MFFLFTGNTYSLNSELPRFTAYEDIPFQNTSLTALMEKYGEATVFDPPGEVLLPDQVCYIDGAGTEITFYVEHYGPPSLGKSKSTIIGVSISESKDSEQETDNFFARPFPCDKTEIELSRCIGDLCIGDPIEKVKHRLKKEMTYKRSYEWRFDVKLSPDDLVVEHYRRGGTEGLVPDWMYPSHVVRVRFQNEIIDGLYVVVEVDMV